MILSSPTLESSAQPSYAPKEPVVRGQALTGVASRRCQKQHESPQSTSEAVGPGCTLRCLAGAIRSATAVEMFGDVQPQLQARPRKRSCLPRPIKRRSYQASRGDKWQDHRGPERTSATLPDDGQFSYSLPLRWPPLRVNLPRRNSWARFAPIRSAVPIAKSPKTSPAPRLDLG